MSLTLAKTSAGIYVPDALPVEPALARITHLGVGAHQDDLEFMAFQGILECYDSADQWFGGVTCTDGAGSSRSGAYARYTDAEMRSVRRKEQELAAAAGRYGIMLQLDHASSAVKSATDPLLRDDLHRILLYSQPRVVYTHNPVDKHDTHIGVFVALIEAIRLLPAAQRPSAVHGCEGWRNLDWLSDSEKIVSDLSGPDHLAAALNGLFDSQIAGGKRYDLAVQGRRRANATFHSSHAGDKSDSAAYAMDLTPLILDDGLDIIEWSLAHISRLADDVRARLSQRLGR